MLRNVDRMEGGPGDPKDFDEWWGHFRKMFKRVILPILIAVVVLMVISGITSAILG